MNAEITKELEKDGYKSSRKFNYLSINCAGGWLKGKYIKPVEFTDKEEGKTKVNFEFEVVDGIGITGKGGDPEKVTPGTYIVFGSGFMAYLLKNKEEKNLALVYEGMETYMDGKKKVKSHRYELREKSNS